MRELPPEDELLRSRDREPIIIVPPQTWHCLFCQPDGADGIATTVQWLGPNVDGPHGRCADCGQKYCLAEETSMLLRAGVPPVHVAAGERHCVHCSPRPTAETPPTIAWRGRRGCCGTCGQAYVVESTSDSARAA